MNKKIKSKFIIYMLSSLSSLGSDYFINQTSGTQLTGINLLLSQANVWCDGTDSTTLFINSTQVANPGTSSSVNRWLNKNNTSRSFTATSGSFRWNNTIYTSYRGIQNTSNSSYMSYSDPATLPSNSYSIFILCNNSSDNANSFCGIGSATTNGNNAQLTLAYGANLYVLNGSSVAVQEYASGFNPYTSTAITTKPFIFEYIKTQGTNEGFYTGTKMNFTNNNSVSTGSAQQSFCSLFCHNNNGAQALPSNSYIAEVLIFPTALNTTDRQMVESYLAFKYGVQNFLPSNHLFKSAPPS